MFNIRSLVVLAVAAFSGVNSAVLPAGTDVAVRSSGELAVRSGAAETCTLWTLVRNTANLLASCDDRTGAPHTTVIEISSCVGNQNGNIACQKNGGAGGSCVFFDIEFTSNSFTISAHCKNDGGGIVTTNHFDINACLTNDNGNLTC
ncbi:hypothetical protein FB451DRAFT_1401153 [Mycena latifolia]|nr:hypothetical protein FB451DRAFT_1418653 [Mycena latifolia]KAJ7468798.1 hypothetical protein FB451DRAFT_1401153 [Mycena latifolia]